MAFVCLYIFKLYWSQESQLTFTKTTKDKVPGNREA